MTVCAAVIALVHIAWPKLAIDAATVTLAVAALVPWLEPIFKKLKVAGLGVGPSLLGLPFEAR